MLFEYIAQILAFVYYNHRFAGRGQGGGKG